MVVHTSALAPGSRMADISFLVLSGSAETAESSTGHVGEEREHSQGPSV